jgi:hypothetical protein
VPHDQLPVACAGYQVTDDVLLDHRGGIREGGGREGDRHGKGEKSKKAVSHGRVPSM